MRKREWPGDLQTLSDHGARELDGAKWWAIGVVKGSRKFWREDVADVAAQIARLCFYWIDPEWELLSKSSSHNLWCDEKVAV